MSRPLTWGLVVALCFLGACALRTTVPPAREGQPGATATSTFSALLEDGGRASPADEVPDGGLVDDDEAVSSEEGEEEAIPEEEEPRVPVGPVGPDTPVYTADLSDESLARLWKDDPAALGSISLGFADEGRLINAVHFPDHEDWLVVSPGLTWGTTETVTQLTAAIHQVRAQFPEAPPLRVNQISAKEGGYLRPHKSHQNGRDVDLGFYYPTAEPVRVREREKKINVALNWALLKALVTQTDVQLVLVDRRVQKVLYDHALKVGEDRAWLDSIFRASRQSLIQHARRHRDHFHVRFYNPRAQELGRRVAPLLALRPEQNLIVHRVKKGDNLGAIARRYGTSVAALKKVNRLGSNFLRISQQLRIPLKGPCTRCPVPPPVLVPPRRLPPLAATSPAPSEPEAADAGAALSPDGGAP